MPETCGSRNLVGIDIGFPRWRGAHPRKQPRVHHLVEKGLVDSAVVGLDKIWSYAHAPARIMLGAMCCLAHVVVKDRANKKAWIDHPSANRKPRPEWA